MHNIILIIIQGHNNKYLLLCTVSMEISRRYEPYQFPWGVYGIYQLPFSNIVTQCALAKSLGNDHSKQISTIITWKRNEKMMDNACLWHALVSIFAFMWVMVDKTPCSLATTIFYLTGSCWWMLYVLTPIQRQQEIQNKAGYGREQRSSYVFIH